MKKRIFLSILISIIFLSGCNVVKPNYKDNKINNDNMPIVEKSDNIQKQNKGITNIFFDSEDDIKEYLVGEWIYENDYKSQIVCQMEIDDNLIVKLSFNNSLTGESKGDYTGQIKFDRLYSEPNEIPDLICIELKNSDYPGGDFFFKHRTIYDEKRVMSWFLASNGSCIFDRLGSDDYEYLTEEIVFEKRSGETSKLQPHKNKDFYAVFWGKGKKSQDLWLDDAIWTPQEDDFAPLYPIAMNSYENEVPESVLYNISSEKKSELLGDDLFPGDVYFVQTDEYGDIINFISADYKRYIDNGSITPEIRSTVFDILENNVDEVDEYIKLGMTILFDGETIMLDGDEYYVVCLGTNHEENFVREIYYAVNVYTEQIYLYDILNDKLEQLLTN